ncbi:carboxymuconolactone decarboxylase family protein [Bacillaceae bacterium]
MQHEQASAHAGYDVESVIREYKESIGRFREKMPRVSQGYMDFTGACFADGAIKEKEKHLMALAISICLQDEYCIMYHAKEALDKGASEKEILETVAVAAAFGGGSALSQGATLVMDVVEQYPGMTH